jgi:hypothetical protein
VGSKLDALLASSGQTVPAQLVQSNYNKLRVLVGGSTGTLPLFDNAAFVWLGSRVWRGNNIWRN